MQHMKSIEKECEDMTEKIIYNVVDFSLGDKITGDVIVFKTIEDMENAYKDIDNGKDIYVKTDKGEITKLLHQMINTKIYDGSIRLSAKHGNKTLEVEKC